MPENQKFGAVIWPRLVASKLLRRPLGSKRFVADFPQIENLLNLGGFDEQTLREKSLNSHRDTIKFKVFVSTWNVGGVAPSDDLNLDDWLDIKDSSYDIYVLGFQEIVPLSAKNVLGAEKSWISLKWNSLIRKTLNKRKIKEEAKLDEKVQRAMMLQKDMDGSSKEMIKNNNNNNNNNNTREFRCIVSKQMVGIFASVWVRDDLLQYIHNPSVSCIGCGIMCCLGNKGAVSVRFQLHETSFCFVCCHLASGGKQGDVDLRNSDITDIFARTRFSRGASDLPQKILDHDRVVLLGDLNYRISLKEAQTRSLVLQKKLGILLEKDQLRFEFSKGRTFEGWHEGPITFFPTYKYHPNSDQYYGCNQDENCPKKRAPAWCDRILWHWKGLKQTRYDRSESRLSDHRPVRAVFMAEVEVLRSLKSSRECFLSDIEDSRTNETVII